ncbi:hypothetical protein UQ64_11490 [Paenibacillus etheri]|uniref:Uncharacterized protein n=2 Tax=Paenibacillus etheri TaxID=1306852 RepID=A0A0W1B1K2_9BACL|nr:hypothetical protein UQ64_11490 [Paenibacillus etheri]
MEGDPLPDYSGINGIQFDIFSNDAIQIFIMFLVGFLTAKSGWLTHIKELSKPIRGIQMVVISVVPWFLTMDMGRFSRWGQQCRFSYGLRISPYQGWVKWHLQIM